MIKLSVTIPLFRAKYIGWLALESLCRQTDIDFEWEVIIAEENFDEFMGKKEVMKYASRLCKVGCVNFRYIELKKWISLGRKRKMLIQACSKSSKVILGNAADYYSAPKRLATAFETFSKDPAVHWFIPDKVLLYNINTGKTLLRTVRKGRRRSDVIGSALKASMLRKAAVDMRARRRGVDGEVYKCCNKVVNKKMNVVFDKSDNWKYALNTEGLNTITNKGRLFKKVRQPYEIYTVDLTDYFPELILKKLKDAKKTIRLHTRGLRRRGKPKVKVTKRKALKRKKKNLKKKR